MRRLCLVGILIFLLLTFDNPAWGAAAAPPLSGIMTDPRQSCLSHTLALPDGSTLSSSEPLPMRRWRNLDLTLATKEIRRDAPRVELVIGNHATVLSEEEVTIPVDKATLALIKRTAPAASPTRWVRDEYWLIRFRDHPSKKDMWLAYAIGAVIQGHPGDAKTELLQLASGWRIPQCPGANVKG